jgi:hypothetical protein
MDNIVVIVNELTVRVVTGDPSEDTYGQGFSAIFADAFASDKVDVARLLDAKEQRAPVTLRCAMLDVFGPITKAETGAKSTSFVLSVEGITYRKSTHPWENVEPLRRGPA